MPKRKNNKNRSPFPEYQIDYIDDQITFAGAVDKYWDQLSVPWNKDTQASYRSHYRFELGPYFMDRPMAEYDDMNYFLQVIDNIRRTKSEKKARQKNQKRQRNQKPPKTDPMQHYEYILRRLFRIAAAGEGFADPFLGSNFGHEKVDPPEVSTAKERMMLQKSFSPGQEYQIADILLKDPLCKGDRIGLLLMWALAFRNKEACGVTWGDIKPMQEYPGLYKLILHTSGTKQQRSAHTGGKTPNMFRIWVIPQKIYEFLMERKAHIVELIKRGEIQFPKHIRSIDDMPIACKGHKWTVRCTSKELSAAGQQLFRDIKMSKDQYAYFGGHPESSDLLGIIAWDRDITTYTFRRNAATHLFILGLKLEHIQYLMGHKIWNIAFKRHDFSNEDLQYALYQKLCQRPIINDITFDSAPAVLKEDLRIKDISQLNAILAEHKGRIQIRITPYLPHEPIHVSLKAIPCGNESTSVAASYRQTPSQMSLPQDIYMIQEYHDSYKRAKNRLRSERTFNTQSVSE